MANLRVLRATDGMVLTDGEAYAKEIYLGNNENPDNWHEITDEEYAVIEKEQKEKELLERLRAEQEAMLV